MLSGIPDYGKSGILKKVTAGMQQLYGYSPMRSILYSLFVF